MTLKTIAIGVMLVVVGVVMGMSVPNAEAKRERDGQFALSAGSDSEVWRINVKTGAVSICENPRGAPNVPICSPWEPQ